MGLTVVKRKATGGNTKGPGKLEQLQDTQVL